MFVWERIGPDLKFPFHLDLFLNGLCLTNCSVPADRNTFRFDPERATSLAFLVLNELVEVSSISLLFCMAFDSMNSSMATIL